MKKILIFLLVVLCLGMLLTILPHPMQNIVSAEQDDLASISFDHQASGKNSKSFFSDKASFLAFLEQTQINAGYIAVPYEDFCKTGLSHLQPTYPVEELSYSNYVFYRVDEDDPAHFFLSQILYNYELKLAIISEKEFPIADQDARIESDYRFISPESPFASWANYEYDYLFYLNEAGYPFPSYVVRNSLYCFDDLGEKHCNALVEGFLRGMEFDSEWNPVEKTYPPAYWQHPDPVRTDNNGEYEYEVYPDNTVRITRYLGSASHLIIPSELGGMSVISIRSLWSDVNMEYPASYAKRATVTSVTIPEGILYIEDYVFQLCINLEEIHIASSVTYIGTCAFEDCEKLRNVYFYGAPPSFGNFVFAIDTASLDPEWTLYYPKEYTIPWSYTFQLKNDKVPT